MVLPYTIIYNEIIKEGGLDMALTDAKRRANNKYIKENMTTLSCKIRKDKAALLKQVCEDNGDTVNAIFTRAVDAYLEGKGIVWNPPEKG